MILSLVAAIAMAGECQRARVFDPPTRCELQAEQDRCNASRLCRTVIGYVPHDLAGLERGGPANCLRHAEWAFGQVGRGDIVFGTVRGQRHAVLIVDGWVVDNGALSDLRVFPAADLPHLWTAD